MVPKKYLVKLRLILGEYEKHTTHLIEAEDGEQASEQALADESHNDDAGYQDDGHWWDDGYVYRVDDCVEVPWDDAVVLRKYL